MLVVLRGQSPVAMKQPLMSSLHYESAFMTMLDQCVMLAVVRTALKSIAGKVSRGSANVAKLAIFWAGVFIAARFVLESN